MKEKETKKEEVKAQPKPLIHGSPRVKPPKNV